MWFWHPPGLLLLVCLHSQVLANSCSTPQTFSPSSSSSISNSTSLPSIPFAHPHPLSWSYLFLTFCSYVHLFPRHPSSLEILHLLLHPHSRPPPVLLPPLLLASLCAFLWLPLILFIFSGVQLNRSPPPASLLSVSPCRKKGRENKMEQIEGRMTVIKPLKQWANWIDRLLSNCLYLFPSIIQFLTTVMTAASLHVCLSVCTALLYFGWNGKNGQQRKQKSELIVIIVKWSVRLYKPNLVFTVLYWIHSIYSKFFITVRALREGSVWMCTKFLLYCTLQFTSCWPPHQEQFSF